MEAQKTRFYAVVLTGVMIFSGGLPLSHQSGVAQPLPPGAVQGQRPLNDILDDYGRQIERELNQRNQALEELARAQGRELQDSERVKVVREVMLKPHPTSPVQDLTIIVYEFSDGTIGNFSATPVFQPWVKGPFGYETEVINVEEGWYIARFSTPEELQDPVKKPEAEEPVPAVEGKPLSFLNRLIGLFSPSEALACGACTSTPGNPACSPVYTHSACKRVFANVGPEVARDGVKMQWQGAGNPPACFAKAIGTDKQCLAVGGGWHYLAPCPLPTCFQGLGATASHTGTYESPAGPIAGTRASVTVQIQAVGNGGGWSATGSCTLSGATKGNYNCNPGPQLDCF